MCGIYNIRSIYFLLFGTPEFFLPLCRDACRNRKSHKTIDRPHLLRISRGQIFICRHQNGTLACQSIQVQRQCCYQGLSFAGIHLGETSLMQGNPSQNLHVKGRHSQYPVIRLTYGGKSLRQNIIQCFPFCQTFLKCHGQMGKLFVGKGSHLLPIASHLIQNLI